MNFNITRRQFLQYCTASAAALGLSQTDLLKLEKAMATPQTGCSSYSTPVVWVSGQACSGCQTSLLNRVVNVTGGYYDADMINAVYPGTGASQGTPKGLPVEEPELGVVNDVADLLVGDGIRALTPLTSRALNWADDFGGLNARPFPHGYIDLSGLATVSAGAGDLSVGQIAPIVAAEDFFLLVDGSVPTADEKYCLVFDNEVNDGTGSGGKIVPELPAGSITMADALRWMIPKAAAVINIGTCAAFGGIPAARFGVTGAVSVYDFCVTEEIAPKLGLGAVINISGCPPHPDWIVYPVAYYLIHTALPVMYPAPDNRPVAMYPGSNCDHCDKAGLERAQCMGDDGCLADLGCKGSAVKADCSSRMKNTFDDGTIPNSWCVGTPAGSSAGIGDARHPCQACTEATFPPSVISEGFYVGKIHCTDC